MAAATPFGSIALSNIAFSKAFSSANLKSSKSPVKLMDYRFEAANLSFRLRLGILDISHYIKNSEDLQSSNVDILDIALFCQSPVFSIINTF